MKRTVALLLAAVAPIGFSISVGRRIEQIRPSGAKAHLLYLPSGPYLRYASAGFQRVVADGIYLWAIQYSGNDAIKGQERNLLRIFDVITDLSPTFDDAYFAGAFIMATDGGRVEDSLILLDKGLRVRGHYDFPYDAGFYCFLYLKDYARASELFRKAAGMPGCPDYVIRLAVKMAAMVNPRDAYGLYRNEIARFERANPPDVMARDDKKRRGLSLLIRRLHELEVLIETEDLDRQNEAVRGQTGQIPGSVSELRARMHELGMEPKPLEPANDPFTDPDGVQYVMKDGKVASRSNQFLWVPAAG